MGLCAASLGSYLYHRIIDHSSSRSETPVVSVIGSGGKTSLIELLAAEAVTEKRKVLITTTTKMANPQIHHYRGVDTFSLDTDSVSTQGCCTLWGYTTRDKLTPVPCSLLEEAVPLFDLILVEADGANRMPLKLHRPDEPVMLPFTTVTLQVFGASAIGKPPNEVIHRYQGSDAFDETVTIETFLHCMRENVPRRGDAIGLINQVDVLDELTLESLMHGYEGLKGGDLIYGSVHENSMYHIYGG